MSKKNRPYKVDDKSIIKVLDEHTTKHGKLKGRNKKETKILKGACPHHTMKKGKVKSTVSTVHVDGKPMCKCYRCKAVFPGKTFTQEQVEDIINTMKPLSDNAKFLSVAVHAGTKTEHTFSQFGSILAIYKNLYRNMAKVVEKQQKLRNKKKRNRRSNIQAYGTWT